MASITLSELERRLRLMAEHIQERNDLFDVPTALSIGSGCDSDGLSQAEAEAEVGLPSDVREATLALAGSQWCWALLQELEEEWDADITGANGGMVWLLPPEMTAARSRLSAAESSLGSNLLPFAKDGGGESSWLAVANVDGEAVLVQAHRSGETESWDLEDFLDSWSRTGFRVGNRWEDQPETLIEHLAEALGLPEEEWDVDED